MTHGSSMYPVAKGASVNSTANFCVPFYIRFARQSYLIAEETDKKAVQGNRAMPQLFFSV